MMVKLEQTKHSKAFQCDEHGGVASKVIDLNDRERPTPIVLSLMLGPTASGYYP
jgi:hypothetical protein